MVCKQPDLDYDCGSMFPSTRTWPRNDQIASLVLLPGEMMIMSKAFQEGEYPAPMNLS